MSWPLNFNLGIYTLHLKWIVSPRCTDLKLKQFHDFLSPIDLFSTTFCHGTFLRCLFRVSDIMWWSREWWQLWNSDHGHVKEACKDSLKNLQLEYLDLYLIHFPIATHHTGLFIKISAASFLRPQWGHRFQIPCSSLFCQLLSSRMISLIRAELLINPCACCSSSCRFNDLRPWMFLNSIPVVLTSCVSSFQIETWVLLYQQFWQHSPGTFKSAKGCSACSIVSCGIQSSMLFKKNKFSCKFSIKVAN